MSGGCCLSFVGCWFRLCRFVLLWRLLWRLWLWLWLWLSLSLWLWLGLRLRLWLRLCLCVTPARTCKESLPRHTT